MVRMSVIVPMYNVEKYLKQCLDSLAAQTLGDLQVILVNDGSTDNTETIASEYVKQNPKRFRLINKENGGLSDARNCGIAYAEGELIAFLDSDDWVEPSFYEKMEEQMRDGADVCVTDIEYWYQDPSKRFIMKGLSDRAADSIQKKAMLSPMFAWNKVYKASLFKGENGYRYPLHTWYEDLPVTTMIFAKAEKIAYLPECLIHYRQREDSIMGSRDDPRLADIFDVMAMVRENFARAGLDRKYEKELEYLHIEHLMLYGMFRFIRSSAWSSCYDHAVSIMASCYPHWKKNPYIASLGRKNRIFLKCYNRADAFLFNRVIRKPEN